MILLIDNYDSFTYNLYQYIGELYAEIRVFRNDEITLDEIRKMKPEAIVISPGPGFPSYAGISMEVIRTFAPTVPLLGVCLGHQAIGEAMGGHVIIAGEQVHGKSSEVTIDTASRIFKNLPDKITVARYHSLIVERATFPESLQVIAQTEDGLIMALQHRKYPLFGVQFHPESVMTKFGKKMIRNFLSEVAGIDIAPPQEELLPSAERILLKPYLKTVIEGGDLSESEAFTAMECIMEGGATDAQIGSFLTALRMKKETIEEITGFARAMRKKSSKVPNETSVIDVVGTGGDMANTFNISTTTAFVVAGAGASVAKHGNRSVSSRSGSADVLEALGVKINITPEKARACLEHIGISFMFAPVFHKSMKFAASPRRELGVRSVFNILGPLSSPASAEYMLLGVYDKELLPVMAQVLANLGVKKALICHGADGLDEITITGETTIYEVNRGEITQYEISPEMYGVSTADQSTLLGGTAEENAKITLGILQGGVGEQRDVVLLNAAAALYAAGKADSMEAGMELARDSIDSGKALAKLNELIEETNK